MKRTSLSAAILVLIGLGAAVVGGPEAPENGAAITGAGGSAGATTAVGPNGTMYRTTIENTASSCLTSDHSRGLDFGEFHRDGKMTRVNFSGTVQTSDPCHRIGLNVTKASESVYRLDIVEVSTLGENESCQFCTGAVEFRGSFEAKGDYRLEVFHDGESVFNGSTEGYGSETDRKSRSSGGGDLLQTLLSLLGSLF